MLTTGSNNIDIGNVGVAGESNKIRIGTRTTHTDTFIAGIYGVPVINGTQVFVNPNGRLGTMLSSDRFKEAIKPMDKGTASRRATKARYGSLKSPSCSCVSITLPARSYTRITASCERL
jgi:hypothetical protein